MHGTVLHRPDHAHTERRPAAIDRPLSVLALARPDLAQDPNHQRRIGLLSKHLQNLNVVVDLQTMPQAAKARKEFLRELGDYDLIWLQRYTAWPWEVSRLQQFSRHLVLDIGSTADDSSTFHVECFPMRWLKFYSTARRCSSVLTSSERPIQSASSPSLRMTRVRNCIDPDAHSLKTTPRLPGEPLRLLWIGTRSTFKHLESARAQLEAIGKLGLPIELAVVGEVELHLKHLPVQSFSFAQAEVARQLARCHVGLVPFAAHGSPPGCSMLEPLRFLANGMPFVGSPTAGNAGLTDGGRIGLLADSPAEWGVAVASFEASDSRRLRMGQRGITYVRQHHLPEVVAERLACEFRALLATTEVRVRRPRFLAPQPGGVDAVR